MSQALRTSTAQTRGLEHVLRVCPADVQSRVIRLDPNILADIEEIRFRVNKPLQLCGATIDSFLHRESGLTDREEEAFVVTAHHLQRVIQSVTQSSLYAVEDDLRRGYVTMPGGHRVGVAGRAVLFESGNVRTLRNITSLNIRIARERIGSARPLLTHVLDAAASRPRNVLVISPPQCGKTTVLRDLIRAWSTGEVAPGVPGVKVCVVDERSELAGCVDGVPQFEIGSRTDVLDACPKAEGLLMAIRSLSPAIVATDEIGREPDRDAILEASHAGVAVMASAHAASLDEWRARPAMRDLFEQRVFDRYVVLSRRKGPGTVEQVLDAAGRPVGQTPPKGADPQW